MPEWRCEPIKPKPPTGNSVKENVTEYPKLHRKKEAALTWLPHHSQISVWSVSAKRCSCTHMQIAIPCRVRIYHWPKKTREQTNQLNIKMTSELELNSLATAFLQHLDLIGLAKCMCVEPPHSKALINIQNNWMLLQVKASWNFHSLP